MAPVKEETEEELQKTFQRLTSNPESIAKKRYNETAFSDGEPDIEVVQIGQGITPGAVQQLFREAHNIDGNTKPRSPEARLAANSYSMDGSPGEKRYKRTPSYKEDPQFNYDSVPGEGPDLKKGESSTPVPQLPQGRPLTQSKVRKLIDSTSSSSQPKEPSQSDNIENTITTINTNLNSKTNENNNIHHVNNENNNNTQNNNPKLFSSK
eukprot:UN22491